MNTLKLIQEAQLYLKEGKRKLDKEVVAVVLSDFINYISDKQDKLVVTPKILKDGTC